MIGLDCASSEFFEDGKYVMKKSSGKALTAEEWIAVLEDWVNKYPIISIEDGMAEGDWEAGPSSRPLSASASSSWVTTSS